MTKQEALDTIKLLSALESWAFSLNAPMPQFLHENLQSQMEVLERIVLDEMVKDESKTIHGFIPWTGGEQPVDNNVKVEILWGDQAKSNSLACDVPWWHGSHIPANIIGYRVIKLSPPPPPPPIRMEKATEDAHD